MISTSSGWSELFKPSYISENLIPESDVNIIHDNHEGGGVTAVTAVGECTEFSDPSKMKLQDGYINRDDSKIATLEWNFWILNGEYELYDENIKVERYVSEAMCGPERMFLSGSTDLRLEGIKLILPKRYTISFPQCFGEYATNFSIGPEDGLTAYNEKDNFDPDSKYIILKRSNALPDMETTGILFQAVVWSMPFRRARVSEFLLGARIFFDKSNLSKFKHQRTMDIVSAELPQNDCDFSVLDIDCDWDINNSNAKYANIVNSNSVFKLYYGYKVNKKWEFILADTLVLESLDRLQNGIEANFSLESTLNRAMQTFLNTESDKDTYFWKSYKQLIEFISAKSGISISMSFPSGFYVSTIKEKLCDIIRKTQKEEYYQRPMKEWLQLAAATINTFMIRQPNGNIYLKNIYSKSLGIISGMAPLIDTVTLVRCFEYPEVENLSKIGQIVLTMLNIPGHRPSDEIDSYWIDTSYGQGAELKYPPSRITVNYGEGTMLNAENKLIALGHMDAGNEVFVSADGIQDSYISFLHYFISGGKKIKINCIINPAWQVGDKIQVQLKDGTNPSGFIIDIDLEYSGLTKGNITILVP